MAVMIGFDENANPESIFEDDDSSKEQKEVDIKKLKEVVFSERRRSQFLQGYETVVVNDFGDDYHLTDEERQAKNKYYEIFKKFNKCKHKYRRLDQYVIAMREMMNVLDYVAENNKVYDPEKFKIMFLKGDINICGLYVPKLIGKAKKYISFDYLSEFIMTDDDPSVLIRKRAEEVYTNEDYEEFSKTLFTNEELEKLTAPITDEEIIENSKDFDESEDDPFDRNIITTLNNKEYKKLLKDTPELVRAIKQSKEDARMLSNMSRYAYELTSDDLDQIERYDIKHNMVTSGSIPVFSGDILDDDAYNRYMYQLNEWEENNTYQNYHGKMKTLSEIKELELKQALEANGWNLRNLYGNKEKEKLLKKKLKEDKRREKELRQQLVEIDKRRRRRMGIEDDDDIREKIKKKTKAKKKKLKKKKNEILLDSSCFDSFDEYADDVLDFRM